MGSASNQSVPSSADLQMRYPAQSGGGRAHVNSSDVFTTYDFVYALGVPEALDRQWKILNASSDDSAYDSAAGLGLGGEPYSRLLGSSGVTTVTSALGGLVEPVYSNARGLHFFFFLGDTGPPSRRRSARVARSRQATRFCSMNGTSGWATMLARFVGTSPTITNRTIRSGAPARISRGGLPPARRLPGVGAV